MTGQQPEFSWLGNRSELLAMYGLSSIAAVTHVRREDDYGLDFLCTLIKQEQKVLRAGRSFGVQVKSSGDPTIPYGGIDRNGRWKQYEVKWLFNQDQPILVAITDLQKWQIQLYSTMRIWYLLFQIGNNPYPGELILSPDEELPNPNDFNPISPQHLYIDRPLAMTADGNRAGNGVSYRVPLGKPIVSFSVDETNTNELANLQAIVDMWVNMDYLNIRHRTMGVRYIIWCQSWETNQLPKDFQVSYFWNEEPGTNILHLLQSMYPAVGALMLNLYYQRDFDGAKALVPLAQMIRAKNLFEPPVLQVLQELEAKLT